MSLALVPVKALAEAKSRLAHGLPGDGEEPRAALAAAMLADVLDALADTPSVERRVVVTSDPEVARLARAAGAEAWCDAPPGLNPALDAAVGALADAGGPDGAGAAATAVLVVLGDVAGARAEDLEALHDALRELGGRGVVLAPSADGGTAALLRAPAGIIAPAFGPDSARAHRARAQRAGVPYRELRLPSLSIDLDSADDVRAFLAQPGGGERTRAALGALGWDAA